MSKKNIEECVKSSLESYFADLHGVDPAHLHDLMMTSVEKALIDMVVMRAGGNRSKASQWLGINRNTLRYKMIQYGLEE